MSDEKDTPTPAAPAADPADAGAPRRVRRSRQIEKTEADAAAEAAPADATAEGAEPQAPAAPAAPRPRQPGDYRPARDFRGEKRPERDDARTQGRPERTAQPPRRERPRRDRPRDDRPRGDDRGTANKLAKRTIYRQDVVGTPVPAPPPSAPAQKPAAPDKLTLILHPPPKQAGWKKKSDDKPLTAKEAMKAKLAKQAGGKKDDKPRAATSLEPSWIAASGDGALEAARAAGEAGEALVQAWLDKGNVAAIAALAGIEATGAAEGSALGRTRKAARRALNVLRSRGVSIPEPQASAPKAAAPEEPAEVVASYIPPDGSGTAFFSLTQRLPGGRYRVADVMVRDDVGVVHASSGVLAGKHIRRWKERVEERFGMPPIDIPLGWARWSIAEGRKKNDASKQLVPLGYDSCLTLAAPAPAAAPEHPIVALEKGEPSKSEIEKSVLGSEALHVEPEFRTWGPDRGALEELVSKVGERLSAAEVENRDAVDKAMTEEIRAATDRYFTPERRQQLAARLRDAAVSIRARKGDDAAQRVLALGHAVLQAGLVTQPPQEIPFLLAFFQKGLAMLAGESEGRIPVRPKQATA
jgi:hypothetical protein